MLINGLTANQFFKKIAEKSPSVERTFSDDLNLGYKSEDEILPILNNFFSDEFVNTKELYGDKYFNYDFEGKTSGMRVELKSRRNRFDDYPTTLMPVHKCVSMDLCPNLFVFNFSDGLYYTEWNTNRFNMYEKKMILCKRKGRTDYREHYMVPIADLIRID